MKGKDWLVLGGLGLALWYFSKKGYEAGGGGGGGMPFQLPTAPAVPIVQAFIQESGGVVRSPAFEGSQFRVIGQVDKPLLIQAGAVTPPTMVTYNQNLLSQPMALEGITWRSGTRPQDRPDRG